MLIKLTLLVRVRIYWTQFLVKLIKKIKVFACIFTNKAINILNKHQLTRIYYIIYE